MFAHVGSRAHAIVKVISSRYVHESAHNSDLPHRDKRTMLYRLLTKHNLLHCRQALNHSSNGHMLFVDLRAHLHQTFVLLPGARAHDKILF